MKPLLISGLLTLSALPLQARTFVVDNQNPRATDSGAATAAQPLKTINAAAQQAQAGDEIIVNAGVYRETIVPARGGEAGKPIVYRAAHQGRVVVKATEVWKPSWDKVVGRANLYRAVLPVALLKEFNPFALKATTYDGGISRGQLFYEGKPLRETPEKQAYSANSWGWRAFDEGRSVELHAPDGAPPVLEISTRAALFRPAPRGLGYITLQGFVFEGSANAQVIPPFYKEGNDPQAGAVSMRSGHHWTLENNVVRFAKTTGLDCGSEALWSALDGQPSPDGCGGLSSDSRQHF